MAEPDNMILRQLHEIRTSIDRNTEVTSGRFEKKIDNVKQAALGESVFERYAAPRLKTGSRIEQRLKAVESQP